MQDCNYSGGSVPTKRNGFSRVNATSWGDTPIRGTHEFYRIGSDEPIFLIAHGGKLYSYDEVLDTKTDLCTGSVTTFADALVTFFDVGDKCYFLTGTEFLYYDGTNPVATVKSLAYVPVVAMGKKPDGTEGTPNENFNHLSDFWRESFSSNGTATEYQCGIQYQEDGKTKITLSANLFKAYIYGEEMVEGSGFTFDRTTWKATFSVAPILGTDNVEIQLEADALMDETVITKCTMAIEYGGKNDSRVMISGHPSYPNLIRFCAVYDPTYWPQDGDFGVGGDARAISGWGRMNEYLITYKQPGDETSQWYSEIDISSSGDVSFPTYGLNDEFGCIAPRTVHPAQNGLLALSDKGVVWTWPSLVKGQANCKMISRNINGRNGIASGLLDNTQSDLKNAHAEVYRNKYMLHVKDKVWVLDLDYSDLANNVFCWYPYSGLYGKAGGFIMRSDVIYMSDNTIGLLYKEKRAEEYMLYADDGEAIIGWWTSPVMFLGGREWVKKFERIRITFKTGVWKSHLLTLISDLGVEELVLDQEAGIFDFGYFDFSNFNFGVINPDYPSTQSEKIGYKGEYFQFKVSNSLLNNGLTVLAVGVEYSLRKKVK